MNKKDVAFARNLIKSINVGIDNIEGGSTSETGYLHEKVTKLHDLIVE